MQISFNGVIRPYTYNCPYAFKLRNIDKIYPSDVLPKTETEEQSSASFGIEQHELASQYINREIESYEHSTKVIEHLRGNDNVRSEETRYISLDLEPLSDRPASGNFISYRTDASEITESFGRIYDLKFGNPDYGHTIYYDEVEFFLMGESLHHPEIGQWSVHVHFPIPDYTLPVRSYDIQSIARIQTQWLWRIDRIMSDTFYKPKPSKVHCRFCDYRPIEKGGCGVCEHSVE